MEHARRKSCVAVAVGEGMEKILLASSSPRRYDRYGERVSQFAQSGIGKTAFHAVVVHGGE